jgi:predicted RNA-binding protein with RPS1 domain
MITLFCLSDGTEVKGDIHNVDDMTESKISLCIKKVENSEIITEHMGRGIITCNSPKLEFKADRSGMIEDEDT